MKIRVNEKCQGHMMCVLAAEHLFRIDDEIGSAHVIHPQVSLDDEEAARLAIRSCPEGAIEIIE